MKGLEPSLSQGIDPGASQRVELEGRIGVMRRQLRRNADGLHMQARRERE
jgi:hypothetical protein